MKLVGDGDTTGADTFGAIATGGQQFTEGNVAALEDKATYSGPAVGAHHKTGSGVSSFDGDANLTADFDEALMGLLEPSRERSITSQWVAATPWRRVSIW